MSEAVRKLLMDSPHRGCLLENVEQSKYNKDLSMLLLQSVLMLESFCNHLLQLINILLRARCGDCWLVLVYRKSALTYLQISTSQHAPHHANRVAQGSTTPSPSP